MNNRKNRTIFYLFFSIFFHVALSQSKFKDTVIVDVVKAFQPTITNAIKISENPSIFDTIKKIPLINYSIQSKKINTSFEVDKIRPAKMVGEPLAKLYRSLVKAGIGNYTTPYGELFYNNLRSKEISYGLHLKHLSSSTTLKNYGFAGYSDNEFSLYGKKFLKKQTLAGDLNYNRNVVHHYGYNSELFSPVKDSTKQRFAFFNPKLNLVSHYKDSTIINHDLKVSYYNLIDQTKTAENNAQVDASFFGYLSSGELIHVNTVFDFYNNKSLLDTNNNTILRLNPSILSLGEKWKASLGLSVVGDFGSNNTFHFYPNINFNYHIISNILIPYAGISGGWNKNSFKSLSDLNPFIVSNVSLVNSDNKYNAFVGLRGTVEASTSFNIHASYAQINNAPLFVNNYNELLQNRFNVIYDDIKQLNLHGELNYQKNEKLKLLAKGDYYKYTMANEIAPWYKPQFVLTLSGNYSLKDKIVLKTDIFSLSKQFAKLVTQNDSINTITKKELKGIVDINLGAEYRYTKNLSAFINFNNIGAFRYYRWNNYPAQRFNFLIGFSYSF